MLNFIVEVIIWCLCIYGFLSIIKDFSEAKSYNQIKENVKLILTVKDAENGIENYIRSLNFSRNFFNNLIVIDLDSKDNTIDIVNRLKREMNLQILKREDGIEYLEEKLKHQI